MRNQVSCSSSKSHFIVFAALTVLVFLVYYSSFSYPFLFDDKPNILAFFDIRHKKFTELFLQGSRWIATWLNTLYYKIDRFNPVTYRLGNVLIHLANGVLLYTLLVLLIRKINSSSKVSNNFIEYYGNYLAAFIAGLFLLHPVQTQTVCYVIQGQLEGLALLAILLILLLFYRAATINTLFSRTILSILLMFGIVLSAGTKEIAIISPILVLWLDWFFIAQGSWKDLLKRWYLHALVWITALMSFCYMLRPEFFLQLISFKLERAHTIGNIVGDSHTAIITPLKFFISELPVIVHYMWIFFWPFGISVDYDMQLASSFWLPQIVFSALVLITLLVYLFFRLSKNNTDLIAACFIWFFVAILPRATVFPSSELIVDYKTYPASPGILALMAGIYIYLFGILAKNLARRSCCFMWTALGITLSLYSFASYKRTQVWSKGLAFWGDIIKKAPTKARAYNNYAVALIENNQFNEALKYAQKAIELDKIYADPWNNLAIAYGKLGDPDAAINALKRALAIAPGHPEGYNNLAAFLLTQERYKEASEALETALKLRPYYGNALMNQGRMYYTLGRIPEAHESFKKCCTAADLDNKAIGFASWGMTSMQLGFWQEAIDAYSKAVQFEPTNLEYRQQLAQAYLVAKKYAEARPILEKLYQENQDHLPTALAYAEVLLKTGKYSEALEIYKRVYTRINCINYPVTYVRMAACYYKLNQFAAAQAQLTEFLNCNPPARLKALAGTMISSVQAALEGKNQESFDRTWAQILE